MQSPLRATATGRTDCSSINKTQFPVAWTPREPGAFSQCLCSKDGEPVGRILQTFHEGYVG